MYDLTPFMPVLNKNRILTFSDIFDMQNASLEYNNAFW